MYGELTKEPLMSIADVNNRELALLGILMLFALYLGVYPHPAMAVFSPSVDLLMNNFNAGLLSAGGA